MIDSLQCCEICPRRCKVNRHKGVGYCGAGDKVKVALVSLHKWEEPCLVGDNGAGTIFFSNCNLRCVYCQNHEISHGGFGEEISIERLAEIFIEQQERGAANIELVTPTHYAPQICVAVDLAKERGLTLPVVYNTNAYENVETLELLRDRVDIFLPDLKYIDDEVAVTYSDAPNYYDVAIRAIEKMFDMVGDTKFDSRGLMLRGVIVRHLILPNFRRDAVKILDRLYEKFNDRILISLMNQYTPMFKAAEHHEIDRRLTKFEYRSVVNHAADIGVGNCYIQLGDTVGEDYIPKFDASNVITSRGEVNPIEF